MNNQLASNLPQQTTQPQENGSSKIAFVILSVVSLLLFIFSIKSWDYFQIFPFGLLFFISPFIQILFLILLYEMFNSLKVKTQSISIFYKSLLIVIMLILIFTIIDNATYCMRNGCSGNQSIIGNLALSIPWIAGLILSIWSLIKTKASNQNLVGNNQSIGQQNITNNVQKPVGNQIAIGVVVAIVVVLLIFGFFSCILQSAM